MSDNSLNWNDWLGKHGPQLLLFARTQTRCEADAEDLLQEAVVESSGKSEGNPPDLPLVYTTLRRRAIDLARKTDRRTAREEVTAERSEDCWFDDTIEQKETARLIERAIKNMPEKFREVVMLKIWSELTFAQIAQTLDIPLNTAASRYRYGLEILKRDANLKES
ncbi:MAG: RNA polymerase sigma factor [Verrucomicrobiota bacterium]|nr:RNA polymerase sigma factor [Verrucomicrobiota bacterium]